MSKYPGLELFEDFYSAPDTSWQLFESDEDVDEALGNTSGLVDGINVLGRAVGPFFIVDGKSQNNRFYPKKLWEQAIKKENDRIERGQMLGTIGHDQALDDVALREGRVSHRVTKLWINEKNVGMGEVLILNTPTGRILNSYLRSGVKLPVSSRGYGKYSGNSSDGAQMVDPDSYKLETFDFVSVPGVQTAIPGLVESDVDRAIDNRDVVLVGERRVDIGTGQTSGASAPLIRITEDGNMEVLQKMTEEKIRMEEQLRQVAESNSSLQEQNRTLNALVATIQEKLEQYEQLGSIEELMGVMDITEGILEGTPEQQELMEDAQVELDEYHELGTLEEIEEVFHRVEGIMEMQKEIGTPDETQRFLEEADEALNEYKEYGSPTELEQVFNETESFIAQVRELGSISELSRVLDLMEQYVAFGSPSELDRAFRMMESAVGNMKSRIVDSEAAVVAENYGVDISVARSLVESLGGTKARETLSAINESRSIQTRPSRRTDGVSDRYRLDESIERRGFTGNPRRERDRPNAVPLSQRTGPEPLKTSGSRISRLFETMSR